jgi:dolichol-phosphate mannosyltransferase
MASSSSSAKTDIHGRSGCFVIYLLIPLFNEAENIVRLLGRIRDLKSSLPLDGGLKVVLVDDGSTDSTVERAETESGGLDVLVLRNSTNQGPGHAFATGFDHLCPIIDDDDWLITMEGDNTSNVELLGQMFKRTEEGYDVILASPYMYNGGIVNTKKIRMFLSYMANVFVKEGLGISGILTASSFFRLYRGSVIRRLQRVYGPRIVEARGFESMVEMLAKMVMLEFTISEVPMKLDASKSLSQSKMRIFSTIIGYGKLYLRKNRWEEKVRRHCIQAETEHDF